MVSAGPPGCGFRLSGGILVTQDSLQQSSSVFIRPTLHLPGKVTPLLWVSCSFSSGSPWCSQTCPPDSLGHSPSWTMSVARLGSPASARSSTITPYNSVVWRQETGWSGLPFLPTSFPGFRTSFSPSSPSPTCAPEGLQHPLHNCPTLCPPSSLVPHLQCPILYSTQLPNALSPGDLIILSSP